MSKTTPAAQANPFGDLTKIIEQFKVPGVDMSAIVEARREDIEALVEANKAAYESMQALARKQGEMLTQAMQGIQDAVKGAVGGAGFADPAKQAELARKACEKALADMKELAEMARNSQADTLAHITQRASKHAEALKKLMQPK
ncbi:MAG: phasin family protein [Rhodoferax sp.]|nr:phasin family protein [Rhodoferax sp.]